MAPNLLNVVVSQYLHLLARIIDFRFANRSRWIRPDEEGNVATRQPHATAPGGAA
jgi:hypothetical protein